MSVTLPPYCYRHSRRGTDGRVCWSQVGQYVALLIALRDQYSNICKLPPGAGNPEISVVNVQLVKGDIDAANLRCSPLSSYAGWYAGGCNARYRRTA